MKNVVLAKTAGFCFGVKRAVELVYEQIEKNDSLPIYTYGPIIHNEQVVKDMEAKGVQVIKNMSALSELTKGIVVLRSHGVTKKEKEYLVGLGFGIVDATCPFVKKIHKIVEKESELGKHIIIIGNEKHPEVIGIKGWCKNDVTIMETQDEAQKFAYNGNNSICIVSQTTFNYNKFQELVEIISKKGYDIIVLNTICNATEERQTEAAQIATTSDAMIIIGSKTSSNTQKLFEISKKECENTYYIQTLSDLDLQKLKSFRNVGITAGASTPNKIIEEVHKNVRRNNAKL